MIAAGSAAERARARGRPADRPAQAGDPRARVLRPRRVRRAGARLRGRRRHGGSEEGPAGRRREHPRGPDQPRADGHPLHRADGHREDVRGRGVRPRVRPDDDQAEELPVEVGRRDRGQPREDPHRHQGDRPGRGDRRRGRPRVRQHRERGRRRDLVARHRAHQGVHVGHVQPRTHPVPGDDEPARQARRRPEARRPARPEDPVPLLADAGGSRAGGARPRAQEPDQDRGRLRRASATGSRRSWSATATPTSRRSS